MPAKAFFSLPPNSLVSVIVGPKTNLLATALILTQTLSSTPVSATKRPSGSHSSRDTSKSKWTLVTTWALNKTECECTKVDTNAILSSCAKTDVSQWRTQFDGYLKSRLDACKSASLPTDFILTELPKSSSEVCRNSLLSAAQESGICTKWATDKNSCYCGHIDTNIRVNNGTVLLKVPSKSDLMLAGLPTEGILRGVAVITTAAVTGTTTAVQPVIVTTTSVKVDATTAAIKTSTNAVVNTRTSLQTAGANPIFHTTWFGAVCALITLFAI
ncbi:hypothetical protein BCR33DRAFT_736536 [Rhizoclosmatium globosum]|uniref:Uncharacterized protein n=1 Tax=Rhizoclosmatium globosum TaxID=329046 RepID=A0A1Y2CJJ3_9FUNG|nr:hypothetical protein BCR33DRAFT_736536 [Rhizoclosmatium globosum]|eukprot:ORY47077.1 hypothetical protein BCR33DRAFT_736536 [Rhizoclosmatium globosum]